MYVQQIACTLTASLGAVCLHVAQRQLGVRDDRTHALREGGKLCGARVIKVQRVQQIVLVALNVTFWAVIRSWHNVQCVVWVAQSSNTKKIWQANGRGICQFFGRRENGTGKESSDDVFGTDFFKIKAIHLLNVPSLKEVSLNYTSKYKKRAPRLMNSILYLTTKEGLHHQTVLIFAVIGRQCALQLRLCHVNKTHA